MAEIIYADGSMKEIEPIDGLKFQYEEVTKIVEGYIEIVDFRNGNFLIVN